MSKTRTNRTDALGRAGEWLRTLIGAREDAKRSDGGAETGSGGAVGADAMSEGPTDEPAVGGYREQVDRLIAEGREKEADIVELVGQSGGTVRQQNIVETMSYSEAVVSRRLQMLERTGLIVRLTRGREKIVCLPDLVPDEFRE